MPSRAARDELRFVLGLSLPAFVVNGLGAHLVAGLLGVSSPGAVELVAASLLGGLAAMAVVLVIAYYGTLATIRTNLDPDTYGIPMVTSTVDLVGAMTLIVAISVLGLT